jgi:asparagine synthase (glutamine-hydrolysing)
MPGIVGLITKAPRREVEPQLLRMVSAIRHQPTYTTGIWIDESLGVYVGWALRTDSFSQGMPLVNETGDVVLAFSGEEYSRRTIAAELKRQGHELSLHPASHLVHWYEEDPSFPAGLNGRFHGLLIDRRADRVTLFNDRSGMQRLYYHESEGALYFAAEAKAILAVRPQLRRIDVRGLGEYLSFGCVLENRTLFHGLRVLAPGSAWRFQNGAVQRETYFDPSEWEGEAPLDPSRYYLALRETFSQVLPRYFDGEERVGMSVTGGLDTRMIMAWHNAPPGSIPCYSFVGTYRDSQDAILGRQLAALWGQPHHRVEVGQGFLSQFPEYARRTVFLTDGCADVSVSPVLYSNAQARQIAPVRMTGNYGSEVLRANRAFKPEEPLARLFSVELTEALSDARSTYCQVVKSHPVTFAAFRQAPWHHQGLFALEGTELSVRSPFLDNDLVRAVYRSPKAAFADSDVSLRLIEDGNPALRKMRTDRGLGTSGPAGAVSRSWLEFTFKAEYAYNYGMPQWLARVDHLLSPLRLERLFLGRHKYYHFRVWYRDQLADYIQEMLLDPLSLNRWFVNKETVQRVVSEHVSGRRNYTTSIHQVLTLELLHRTLLDPQTDAAEGR